jgi:hypothetical protein
MRSGDVLRIVNKRERRSTMKIKTKLKAGPRDCGGGGTPPPPPTGGGRVFVN